MHLVSSGAIGDWMETVYWSCSRSLENMCVSMVPSCGWLHALFGWTGLKVQIAWPQKLEAMCIHFFHSRSFWSKSSAESPDMKWNSQPLTSDSVSCKRHIGFNKWDVSGDIAFAFGLPTETQRHQYFSAFSIQVDLLHFLSVAWCMSGWEIPRYCRHDDFCQRILIPEKCKQKSLGETSDAWLLRLRPYSRQDIHARL